MHGYMDGQRIDEIDMFNPKQSRIESKRVGKKRSFARYKI